MLKILIPLLILYIIKQIVFPRGITAFLEKSFPGEGSKKASYDEVPIGGEGSDERDWG